MTFLSWACWSFWMGLVMGIMVIEMRDLGSFVSEGGLVGLLCQRCSNIVFNGGFGLVFGTSLIFILVFPRISYFKLFF